MSKPAMNLIKWAVALTIIVMLGTTFMSWFQHAIELANASSI